MKVLIGLKRCSTCQKIEKLLKDNQHEYEYREIDQYPPTHEEILEWMKKGNYPIQRFWNTSGIKYREEKIASKRKNMADLEQAQWIEKDGMLCKRPILLDGDGVFVGKDVEKYLQGEVK